MAAYNVEGDGLILNRKKLVRKRSGRWGVKGGYLLIDAALAAFSSA